MHNARFQHNNWDKKYDVWCKCGFEAKAGNIRAAKVAVARHNGDTTPVFAKGVRKAQRNAVRVNNLDGAARLLAALRGDAMDERRRQDSPEVAVENPRTHAEWKAYIRHNQLERLGAGVSRTTYALDHNRVIKIENTVGRGGFNHQCAAEVNRWNRATATERQYLAAIYDSGEGWVIMERATMTLFNFGGRDDVISRDLATTTGIEDLHAANIGYFGNGIFKILDYGL